MNRSILSEGRMALFGVIGIIPKGSEIKIQFTMNGKLGFAVTYIEIEQKIITKDKCTGARESVNTDAFPKIIDLLYQNGFNVDQQFQDNTDKIIKLDEDKK